jgi:hypothetical protein
MNDIEHNDDDDDDDDDDGNAQSSQQQQQQRQQQRHSSAKKITTMINTVFKAMQSITASSRPDTTRTNGAAGRHGRRHS